MKKLYALDFVIFLAGIVLWEVGCAPMVGTSKLVYRSSPRKPRWMQVIPQSRMYEYFVGVSDNRTSLDEAKKAAILDALNDAVSKKGIEVSVNYQNLSTEEKSFIRDSIDITGAMKLGLEQVAWYYEEWEQYYRNRAQKSYRVFMLLRSRKIHPSNFLIGVALNIGNRFDAFWHSMLIPGWGQFRNGKKGKGNYFLFSTLVSAAGWGVSNVMYDKINNDQYDIQERMKALTSGSELIDLQRKYRLNNNNLKELKTYKQGFMYATAGFYGLNLIDAILFGPPSSDKFSALPLSRHLYLTVDQINGCSGIKLTYKFPNK